MTAPLHTIEVIYQTRTAEAVCVRAVEDGPDIWLPLSRATVTAARGLFGQGNFSRGALATLTAPEALLLEKGLL